MAQSSEIGSKLSTAFQDRCIREKERLQSRLAQQLRDDIGRLFDEEIHADMTLSSGKQEDVHAHRFIISSRGRRFLDCLHHVAVRIEEESIVLPKQIHLGNLKNHLRNLYVNETVEEVVEDLTDSLINDPQLTPLMACQTAGPLEASQANTDTNHGDDNYNSTTVLSKSTPLSGEVSGEHPKYGNDAENSDEAANLKNVSAEDNCSSLIGELETATENHSQATAYFRNGGSFEKTIGNFRSDQEIPDVIDFPNGERTPTTCYDVKDEEKIICDPNDVILNCTSTNDQVENLNVTETCTDNSTKDEVQNLFMTENCVCNSTKDQVENLIVTETCDYNSTKDQVETSNINRNFETCTVAKNGCLAEEKDGFGSSVQSKLSDVIKQSYDISVPYEVCSKLGEDLLRSYLQESLCDCVILASGEQFAAHKCILSARSSYFQAMLGGSWCETSAASIVLEGISPGTMEQALLYLYGGVVELDDTCPPGELTMMADMYCLEGLKEIVIYNLRKTYCHMFHKPCPGCISGVIEALPVSVLYNLSDLQNSCLKWIAKNFTKIWPTKPFASLEPEILKLCYTTVADELTVNTVIDILLDCHMLNRSMPRLKWAETVLDLVTSLMDRAIEFTSQNFTQILSSQKFLAFDRGMALCADVLEEIFSAAIKSLTADKACQTYLSLCKLQENSELWTEDFQSFLTILVKKTEDYLKLYIHQVANSQGWDLLSSDMQTKILQTASYVCIDNAKRGKVVPPRLSSMHNKPSMPTVRPFEQKKAISSISTTTVSSGQKKTTTGSGAVRQKTKLQNCSQGHQTMEKRTKSVPNLSVTANQSKPGMLSRVPRASKKKDASSYLNQGVLPKSSKAAIQKRGLTVDDSVVAGSHTKSISLQASPVKKSDPMIELMPGTSDTPAVREKSSKTNYSTSEAAKSDTITRSNERKRTGEKNRLKTYHSAADMRMVGESSTAGSPGGSGLQIPSRQRSLSFGEDSENLQLSTNSSRDRHIEPFGALPKLLPIFDIKFVVPCEFDEETF